MNPIPLYWAAGLCTLIGLFVVIVRYLDTPRFTDVDRPDQAKRRAEDFPTYSNGLSWIILSVGILTFTSFL